MIRTSYYWSRIQEAEKHTDSQHWVGVNFIASYLTRLVFWLLVRYPLTVPYFFITLGKGKTPPPPPQPFTSKVCALKRGGNSRVLVFPKVLGGIKDSVLFL